MVIHILDMDRLTARLANEIGAGGSEATRHVRFELRHLRVRIKKAVQVCNNLQDSLLSD